MRTETDRPLPLNWAIDPVHSRIRFESKYLLLTAVSGWLTEFEGQVISQDPQFSDSSIDLIIYSHSIFTGNPQRDAHLKSADFFDACNYPIIRFRSLQVRPEAGQIRVTGLLTIKNIDQEIEFLVNPMGQNTDPNGNTKAGFVLDAHFNRKDFNITWNQYLEKGMLIADDVTIHADIQLLLLPPASDPE